MRRCVESKKHKTSPKMLIYRLSVSLTKKEEASSLQLTFA